MTKARTYNEGREHLFKRLLQLGGVTLGLVTILNLVSGNKKELYVTIAYIILFLVAWVLFDRISKKIAYHLVLLGFISLICIPIFVLGNSYYAILIYPITALIYNFVYFDSKKIWWLYYVLVICLEFFLLKSTMQIDFNNIPSQFFAEFINAIAYLTTVFFIGNFFIANLKKQQEEINIAKVDIEQKGEQLITKNAILDKYIESNIQLESFAHLAAHELKAPLRSISGFAGLLKRKVKDKLTEDELQMFDIISKSNRQMHDMIGALNQLGSVSKMELSLSEFNIKDLLDEIIFDRKESIQERNAIIDFQLSTPIIIADKTLLKQLLSNLIGNALKFVSEDTVPEILVTLEKTEGALLFKVDDNGIGIKKENFEKVFALFERLHNESAYSGSGIGLAICKKITELHNGKIWVEASPLNGSRFSFTIPIEG